MSEELECADEVGVVLTPRLLHALAVDITQFFARRAEPCDGLNWDQDAHVEYVERLIMQRFGLRKKRNQ